MDKELWQPTLHWLLTGGLRVLAILLGTFLGIKLLRYVVQRMIHLAGEVDETALSEREQRAKTIGGILKGVGTIFILGIALMMLLHEFGLDITPIIAGAGVAGLAFGLGAQNLIKDIIGGFFILLEDQFRVGDVIAVAGVRGQVEKMSLRATILRDIEGTVHVIPNSEIKIVSNMTKEWARVALDVQVAYKEDIDAVIGTLKAIGAALQQDSTFGPLMLEPLEVLGVESLADSSVVIKILVKTKPLKQWDVARELRKRIKKTFAEKNIEIPYPHQVHLTKLEGPVKIKGGEEIEK